MGVYKATYMQFEHTLETPLHSRVMEFTFLSLGLRLALTLLGMKSALPLNDLGFGQRADHTQGRAGAGASPEVSSVTCKLQGTAHPPAFSMDGDYIIGGVFSIHSYMDTVKHNYTAVPTPLRCTGRLVLLQKKIIRHCVRLEGFVYSLCDVNPVSL